MKGQSNGASKREESLSLAHRLATPRTVAPLSMGKGSGREKTEVNTYHGSSGECFVGSEGYHVVKVEVNRMREEETYHLSL